MVKLIENCKISKCKKLIFLDVDVQKLMIRYATILKIYLKVIFEAMLKTFKTIIIKNRYA